MELKGKKKNSQDSLPVQSGYIEYIGSDLIYIISSFTWNMYPCSKCFRHHSCKVQGVVSQPHCHGFLAPVLFLLVLGSIFINISLFQERPLEKLCNISGSPHGALRKPLCGLGPKSFSVRQRQLSINWIWHRYEMVWEWRVDLLPWHPCFKIGLR